MTCPARVDLLRYLQGRTSDSQTEVLELHLANCNSCQVQLEVLADESDSMLDLVASAVGPVAILEQGWPSRIPASTEHPTADGNATATSDRCQPGSMISNYRLMECIGQGGMGTVYRAIHVQLDQQYALKILKADRSASQEALSRFAREMRLSARLEHPHIVNVKNAGEHAGLPYLVMEFVNGVDLSHLVRRVGKLAVPDACHIVQVAATALQYIHDQHVIHRDVKPSNLMITVDGKVKLLDLGLGQFLELHAGDSITRADQALGTLAYMSPEQFSGRYPVTKQSDIFSLGLTFHELLTGQRPGERPGSSPFISDLCSLRHDVSEDLNALISDMLAQAPSARPASMAEVESRLRGLTRSADLSSLVTRYLHWQSTGFSTSMSELEREDTAVAQAHSTDRQAETANLPFIHAPACIAPPKPNRSPALSRLTAAMGLALVILTAAFMWTIYKPAEPAPPVPQANVTLIIDPGDSTVIQQLLENGGVFIKNKVTGEIAELRAGEIEFPPGKYEWSFTAPVALEEDGKEFEIAKGMKRLKLDATLTQAFENPDLPTQAGASQSYRGQIWRSGWNPDTPLNFNLTLEVMDVRDEPEQPVMTRLRIEISDLDTGYTETGYLEIDTQKWRQSQLQFSADSWIEARSEAIDAFLAEQEMLHLDAIVLPFDRNHDRLATLQPGLLPTQRLSVHDALSLFFGQKIDAAANDFNKLRHLLLNSGKRHSWLAMESNGFADVLCYVVSSRSQFGDPATDGYMLARRTSPQYSPFGFVKLEVRVDKMLTAVCQTITSSPPDPNLPPGRARAKLNQLRQDVFDTSRISAKRPAPNNPHLSQSSVPLTLDSVSRAAAFLEEFLERGHLADSIEAERDAESLYPPSPEVPPPSPPDHDVSGSDGPIDQATLPDQPSFVKIAGTIAVGTLPTETIEATIAMLGSEVIDGREYRWIEVEVKSSREKDGDYWEAARLQIDVQAYEDSHQFVIRRSLQSTSPSLNSSVLQAWIAFGDKQSVFAIPHDGNLAGLINWHLQLPSQQKFDRIGVVDLLSLVFDARLEPRTTLSSLRPKINSILVGVSREPQINKVTSRTGEEFVCVRWMTPPSSQLLTYSIDRCSQIPFGFYAVNLNVTGSPIFSVPNIDIRLALENQRGQLPHDFSASVFGTNRELGGLLQNNLRRLQTSPNWRVWTWSEAGKTYKAWAEFGGTIEPYILLRKRTGQETRVPSNSLTDADRTFVNQGRWWDQATFGTNKFLQRVLVKDDPISRRITFSIPSNSNSIAEVIGEPGAPVDRIWLE